MKVGKGTSVNGSKEIKEETLRLTKQRNSSMERELKEMQERYSEISVMFAQVEGERQELVMTVCCLLVKTAATEEKLLQRNCCWKAAGAGCHGCWCRQVKLLVLDGHAAGAGWSSFWC